MTVLNQGDFGLPQPPSFPAPGIWQISEGILVVTPGVGGTGI